MKKLPHPLSNSILVILFLLYGSLCFDTVKFYRQLQIPDGEGVGLFLLGGLIEVNDRIPYSEASAYLHTLFAVLIVGGVLLLLLSILFLRSNPRCSNRPLPASQE